MRNFVGIKLIDSNAKRPAKANKTDAGFDLYACEDSKISPKNRRVVRTGVCFEMPNNIAGLIWPRSGLSVKQGIDILAGVVDPGYRGEVMVCLYNTSDYEVSVEKGDRIAQLIFQEIPEVSLFGTDTLNSSDRGEKGFGSSGK